MLALLSSLVASASALHLHAPSGALRAPRVAMMADLPDVRTMDTKDLRQELNKRGISASGKAKALRQRLSEVLENEPASPAAVATAPAPEAAADGVFSAADREKLMAARFPNAEQVPAEMTGSVVPATPPPAAAVPPPAFDMTQQPAPPMAMSSLMDAVAPAYQRERLDIGRPAEPPRASAAAMSAAAEKLPPVAWLGPFGSMVEGNKYLARPAYLDDTLAGDAGFDPLGFCVNGLPNGMPSTFGNPSPSPAQLKANVMWMREAEVKHGRLAMLAAAGWPLAELLHGPISQVAGLPFALDATQGRSPSLLNGHLFDYTPFLAVATLGMIAVEMSSLDQQYGLTRTGMTVSKKGNGVVMQSYVPGDLGFDPLGVYGVLGSSIPAMTELRMENEPKLKLQWDAYQQKEMEAWEIYHGRAAMLGITGFAVQEFTTGVPVVDQTPAFFSPFWESLAPGAVASLGLF